MTCRKCKKLPAASFVTGLCAECDGATIREIGTVEEREERLEALKPKCRQFVKALQCEHLAAVEAERDAAKALAKEWEAKAMDAANHPVVQVLLQERDAAKAEVAFLTVRNRQQHETIAVLHADLKAARAGEARAVEALGEWLKLADHNGLSTASHRQRTRALISEPALDWLAQDRREAAAKADSELWTAWPPKAEHGLEVLAYSVDEGVTPLECRADEETGDLTWFVYGYGEDATDWKWLEWRPMPEYAALRAGKVQDA